MSQMSSETFSSLPLSEIFPEAVEDHLMQELAKDGITFPLANLGEFNDPVLHQANLQANNDYQDCKPVFQEDQLHHDDVPIPKSLALTNTLSNEEYLGPFDFEVGIHPSTNVKHSWEFSSTLNKIYMKISTPFPVDFKTKMRPSFPLYIRVTPQYSQSDHSQDYVHRCLHHEHPTEKTNLNMQQHIHPHIMRCSSNTDILYVGQKGTNERLSLLMPFIMPQTGSDSVRETFQFVCTSSCPEPGINRRLLEIIFTLEDECQRIFGRNSINVRICSCPKRDKMKEEEDNNANSVPKSKKRKLDKSEKQSTSSKHVSVTTNSVHDNTEPTEYPLNFKICGKHNYLQVLKYCADLMSGDVLRNKQHGTEGPYMQCLNDINVLMNKEKNAQ